jgi:hypothetical protein
VSCHHGWLISSLDAIIPQEFIDKCVCVWLVEIRIRVELEWMLHHNGCCCIQIMPLLMAEGVEELWEHDWHNGGKLYGNQKKTKKIIKL